MMVSASDSSDPPGVPSVADWHDVPTPNDFVQRLGRLQRRQVGDGWAYRMLAEEGHRNGAGVVHGGALAAFVDEVIGTIARDDVGRRHVTVQLQTVFLAPVRPGDAVEAQCEIVKVTGSMTFVEARLFVADAVVATASAVLKASRPRP
jgi:uncharacterized protein (TIGR00369 family)